MSLKSSLPPSPVFLRCAKILASIIALGLLIALPAAARDLQGRLGIGYNSEFANSEVGGRTPGVSIKYALTRDIAIEGVVGVNTASPTNSVTAIKLFKNVFYETNLNFYFMLGGGLLNARDISGSEFLGGMGVEFFIPGVDSLGMSVETGGAFHNLNASGSFTFRTLGVSFLDAGIHFYF